MTPDPASRPAPDKSFPILTFGGTDGSLRCASAGGCEHRKMGRLPLRHMVGPSGGQWCVGVAVGSVLEPLPPGGPQPRVSQVATTATGSSSGLNAVVREGGDPSNAPLASRGTPLNTPAPLAGPAPASTVEHADRAAPLSAGGSALEPRTVASEPSRVRRPRPSQCAMGSAVR